MPTAGAAGGGRSDLAIEPEGSRPVAAEAAGFVMWEGACRNWAVFLRDGKRAAAPDRHVSRAHRQSRFGVVHRRGGDLPSRPEARGLYHGAGGTMQSLELFTGAGGLALGTHLAGFRHVALVEWDRNACATLRANVVADALPGANHWRVLQDDVRSISYGAFGEVDLVAGGPPCQPFSIGGKHGGMEDPRDMIPQFIRAVRELRPRAFILENVRGLLRHGFRTYFSYALLQLTYPSLPRREGEQWTEHLARLEDVHTGGTRGDLQYNVVFRLVNAADYGVPQVRQRIFIVGFRADTGVEWHFPEPTHSRETLLHDQWVTGSYWDRHGVHQPSADATNGLDCQLPLDEVSRGLPWRTVRDAISDLPSPTESRAWAFPNHRFQPGARSYTGHSGSLLDLPAKTLKAGVHGVPGGENMLRNPDGSVRYFTVREAARLQTFPDTWRFEGAWSETMRQLGNAVPAELAHTIAKSVFYKLRKQDA